MTEVHALYDFSLPAVTVELWWIPMHLYRLNSARSASFLRKNLRHDVRGFSLVNSVRLSGSEPGCWWETIRRWILEEGGRLGWDFHSRVLWKEVEAPGTRAAATTRAFTDEELTAMAEGLFQWQPTYSIVDLRSRPASHRLILPRREITTDFTPNKLRDDALCSCGVHQGQHLFPCETHQQWLQDKAKWLEWYRSQMGGEPILQPGSVDQARFLRETFV